MSMPKSRAPSAAEAIGDPDPLTRIAEVIDGRYRLLEFVGQGGMGNVYRAEHTTIRKSVALKLLHPSLATVPEIRSRFEREAFAIGRIDHPNCVDVNDFGELADGSLFLVMEFLKGESVADLLERERPLQSLRAVHIMRHLLRGLGHAHRAGIVHRDVKPENIFLVQSEDDPLIAKLLDFGIAKVLDDTSGAREKLTQAGITFGTPTYISPEQALGDPADPRSDLYAATVVLYEMLTGSPPFSSDDKMELLAMHAGRKPPPLREVYPAGHFSAELEAIVARGLAKRADDRFARADELIDALDGLGPGERAATIESSALLPAYRPTTGLGTLAVARPDSLAEPADDPGRSRLGALVAIVAAATALAVGIWIAASRNQAELLTSVQRSEPSELAQAAGEKLEQGLPAKAIEMVKEDQESAADPSAQLKLGHAHAARADYTDALEAYAKALVLEPSSIRDTELIRNLKLMVDGSGPIHVDALRLLIAYADDEGARSRVAELASGRAPKTRAKATELAETLGLGDRIDRVQAAIWDLAQGPTCAKRRDVIPRLRALGDRRALEPLKDALFRKARRGKRNLNACLRTEAMDAIRYLESLPDP
jgi:tRNA A-37 threonylcarbamoyl transferase component Bud32/tetratricopeptide (TPR) repeat protein